MSLHPALREFLEPCPCQVLRDAAATMAKIAEDIGHHEYRDAKIDCSRCNNDRYILTAVGKVLATAIAGFKAEPEIPF